MEPVRRFRLMAVRLALLLTALGGFGGYALDATVGKGILIGGIGGVLAFWLSARSVEKLATMDPKKVKYRAYGWTFVRLLIYGLVLVRAITWDRETLHGFWGAVAGILIIRVVTIFLGLTGLDLKEDEE